MSQRLPFYPQRCWTCEGSGIRPSLLYLVPFWPAMVCKRCEGTGIHGATRHDVTMVYLAATVVIRKSQDEDGPLIPSLQTGEAYELKHAIAELK